MAKKAILCVGIPASGKSFFARELVRKNPNFKRINRDDIRAMVDDSTWDHNREEFIKQLRDTIILTALREGHDVIIDDTNLSKPVVKKLHRLLASVGDIVVIEKAFNTPIEECLRRNALREGRAKVPENVILAMAKKAGLDNGGVLKDSETYYPPITQQVEMRKIKDGLPEIVLVDLDGTIALLNNRSPYDATNCDQDFPNIPVIECVKAMYAAGRKIIFMSGREDQYRAPTERFIDQYLPDMPYELYMRTAGDMRKDSIIKGELLETHVMERFNILFALDDRNQVVQYYRSLGIPVFQVAAGDF